VEEPDKISPQQIKPRLNGESILNEVYDFVGRFVAYPNDYAHVAHALWIAHTHLMDCWDSTPRLAILSPTKACGKTRLLEVTEPLVPNPILAVNATPAYLFRKVAAEEGLPTILYDEIDTVFGRNAGHNEDTRAMINSGHRKGAVAGRVAVRGNLFIPEEIPSYCAMALAGIGMNTLPDTILSRSVIISMRRRAANEAVEPWRERTCLPAGRKVGERLAKWAAGVKDSLTGAAPNMPEGVDDRPRDVWEPLISVADAAGGIWPDRARVACVALVADSQGKTESRSMRLLEDLKLVFATQHKMFTDDILKTLTGIEDAPWDSAELNAYKLARLLRPYGISSKDMRMGGKPRKGYTRTDLQDAWDRYLPLIPEDSATSATSATESKG
jgi:hypothetical protein